VYPLRQEHFSMLSLHGFNNSYHPLSHQLQYPRVAVVGVGGVGVGGVGVGGVGVGFVGVVGPLARMVISAQLKNSWTKSVNMVEHKKEM
jgi:hypothetical protein